MRRITPILVFALLLAPKIVAAVQLPNPLSGAGIESGVDFYIVVIRQFVAVIGLISLVFFLWGGFRMIMSAGNQETLKKAKDTLLWSLLGMIVALLSYSIVQYVFDTVADPVAAP